MQEIGTVLHHDSIIDEPWGAYIACEGKLIRELCWHLLFVYWCIVNFQMLWHIHNCTYVGNTIICLTHSLRKDDVRLNESLTHCLTHWGPSPHTCIYISKYGSGNGLLLVQHMPISELIHVLVCLQLDPQDQNSLKLESKCFSVQNSGNFVHASMCKNRTAWKKYFTSMLHTYEFYVYIYI